ncbi:hypothetical protein [Methylobacterium sp. ap11]|uniref:hypothetical protein n=1 Tax=Methylobacterium sp. ap11 TaxID=1761799 RepID=UPI0015A52CFE|nr:hypothetical protein [Methylobacterium sp. ap11]
MVLEVAEAVNAACADLSDAGAALGKDTAGATWLRPTPSLRLDSGDDAPTLLGGSARALRTDPLRRRASGPPLAPRGSRTVERFDDARVEIRRIEGVGIVVPHAVDDRADTAGRQEHCIAAEHGFNTVAVMSATFTWLEHFSTKWMLLRRRK